LAAALVIYSNLLDVSYAAAGFMGMFPMGALAGLVIGVNVWAWRKQQLPRLVITALAGALASGLALLVLFAFYVGAETDSALRYALAGVVLGLGIGAGSALRKIRRRRLVATLAGGALGAAAGVPAVLGLASPPVFILAGLAVGALTGLGFHVAAVEDYAGQATRLASAS
jgi:hypothetical protein